MIEGLRLLPWLQERIRNDRKQVDYLLDCDACRGITQRDDMRITTQIERQSWGCPYEPQLVNIRTSPWTHVGYTDESPTTCAGYTTKLPEVIEITRARLHWKQGSVRDFCDGRPTDNIQRGIEILEGAVNEAHSWQPPKDQQ